MRSYLDKNPSQNRADGVAQGVSPEFKSQYHKKKTTCNTTSGRWTCDLSMEAVISVGKHGPDVERPHLYVHDTFLPGCLLLRSTPFLPAMSMEPCAGSSP
jgi:hypothetical protein